MAGFDECCPFCGRKHDLASAHPNHDYDTEFQVECECGRTFEVIVHSVPEFETRKPRCCKCNKEITDGFYCDGCKEDLHYLAEAS